MLGRHIPRFRAIIVSQLRSVLRRRHTLPYYKLRSRPLVPPGPIAAAMIAAAGGSSVPCRNAAVLPQDGCSVLQGKLVVTILGCSRLQVCRNYFLSHLGGTFVTYCLQSGWCVALGNGQLGALSTGISLFADLE